MKSVRIILLILIIAGIGLIVTQKKWVPKVVGGIINYEDSRVKPVQ